MSGSDAQRERALSLVLRHGRTATAFRAVGTDVELWEHASLDAAVAYAAPRGAMVSAGEPIAPIDALVPTAEAFVAHATSRGRRASFFATEGRLAQSRALRRRLLGEQPVWDPRTWAAHVQSHRSLREQIRRARAKGVVTERLDAARVASPAVQQAIHTLLERWRAGRSMAPMGFLVTIDLDSAAGARRTVAAWQQGTLVALLSLAPVPARQGWLFEHVLRDPTAPNGTLELLVDMTMRDLAADGVPWATLGLAPLHGDVDPWLRRVRRWSTPLFNFEGLASFKRKLRPTYWEPIYLAWPVQEAGWRVLLDGLRAFAGGSLLRFGMRTVLRGPSPLLTALEWMLIPWTLALASVPTAPWFPSKGVHAAWVLFDAALWLALRSLRTRRSSRPSTGPSPTPATLAVALASAVTVDALLTLTQAIMWNGPRVRTAGDLLAVIVACSAPALAAPMLWGAARRLRTLSRPRPSFDTAPSLHFSA